jgi:hypothetical protein
MTKLRMLRFGFIAGLRSEEAQVALYIAEEEVSQVATEAFFNYNAQSSQVLAIPGKGVGWNQPAPVA